MQIQEYLTFFHELLLNYYTFTLENGIYATCLSISVWLITAMLYSFSFSGLNKKIRLLTQLNDESQSALNTANTDIEALQTDTLNLQLQLAEQQQLGQSLSEQLSEISLQLSSSISSLSANPDLGQQGLTVRDGLPLDQLWQRYHAAIKQICENLTTQIKSNKTLAEASKADTAKIAEKDLQLQAAQMRTDSLKQQIVKLEVSLQELQTRLTQEQTLAEQRFTELDQKYQGDLARLTVVEAQYQADIARLTVLEQQTLQTKTAKIDIPAAIVSIKAPEQPLPTVAEARAVTTPSPEASIVASSAASTPEAAIAETIAETKQPAQTSAVSSSPSGFGSKFKSLLSNAKHKIDKLDEKLGQRTPLPSEAEEPEFLKTPEVSLEIPVAEVEAIPAPLVEISATIPTDEVKAKTDKPFKKLFGFKKAKAKPEPIEIAVEAAPAQVEIVSETKAKADTSGGLGGKFKSLLGGKAKSAVSSQEVEPAPVEPETIPEPEIVVNDKTKAKGVKSLFGKLKF